MIEKNYAPADIESRISAIWEASGAFRAGRPERQDAVPFTIVIPPPNVTGSLHMGHALDNTLQDILARFERMRGRDVLWQPGTDHAGIATQMVVERNLMKRQEPGRRELGREKFIEKVWAWKAESGGQIVNQLKRLGASCDWSRERFTMGEAGGSGDQMVQAVLKAFVELHRAGLIYKAKRLVNWDPEFQSAISDLEVEPREHRGQFKWALGEVDKEGLPVAFNGGSLAKLLDRDPNGHMYYLRYPLAGIAYDPGDPATFVTVGTTRPETMLGDSAVAVHPEHPALARLIGKQLALPLTGRLIPIVGDDYADPEKGTGAVKITPAHDFNDFEVGRRHGLEQINIFDATATLNEGVPQAYRGLDRFAARKKVIGDLVAKGLVEKIEPHTHAVPHAERGDAVIEPWLTEQWYVDAGTLAKPALEAVRSGKTRFVPERFAGDYFRWLENIQPWCISRQLWWGHQIPAWYGDDGRVFVALSQAEAQADADKHYGKSNAPLQRDPDVLDTWFSSGLWPFSTLGWPDKTPEVARFYPTSVLVTGFDIIFFWVARMMMLGQHFMKEVPFRDVYLHGLVLDEKGQKMSKSKGNVVDPLEIIDRYGADALRFAIAIQTGQGTNVKFANSRIEGYRNFATKLWNAARFAEMNECVRQKTFDPKAVEQTLNRWIAGETERTQHAVTSALEAYKFSDAAAAAYEFIWGVFCDWYLELAKPIFIGTDEAAKAETRATTAWALDQILKLLHPFMPFITEELWGRMVEVGVRRENLLALSPWPAYAGLDHASADAEIGWLIRLVSEVRSVRTEMNVPAAAKIPLVLVGAAPETRARAARHLDTILRLARLETLGFADSAPKGSAQMVVGETTACLPLAGVIDMAAERKRLEKSIAGATSDLAKMDAKLSNPQFMAKAAADAIEEARARKAEVEGEIARLGAALRRVETAA